MRRATLAILVLSSFLLLSACDGTVEAYFARVDRVEPPIPGLVAEGTRGVYGALEIKNNTDQVVYLYDQAGQEQYKITATETFRKDSRGNWVRRNSSNRMSYVEEAIRYRGSDHGLPSGRYPGDTMKEWVIAGRAGDTPFHIYGRTVYEPVEW